ncbi:M15 family metallopeptidase [Faecalibacterium sp. An77]|uniref:M15 family metallopeptidase n=1 Tax=Faecalibacterium sp. An77 TaxID=1965655 RepID=UPI001FA93DFB|nr:M15 family metallopeptidase [Faecalibacterium sp. An77]
MQQQPMAPMPNDPSHRPRRKLTRAEIRRRRRRRAARRLTVFFCALALVAGGVSFAVTRMQAAASSASTTTPASSTLPAGSAASGSNSPAASSSSSQAASSAPAVPQNALGLTAAEAQAMLNDSRMVLVNHDSPMPEDYTFDTKECGSATAINKTLQTEAADAFLEMQAAAAADGVTIWMQSGYRSVSYQTTLYNNKTQQYLNQGYDEATARELAAGIVNPPGYSEHNCGLAADLNCPDFTDLDTGFENTTAFAWLCEHAEQYGFILRYPKGEEAEAVTEITYEPWHWRYVGPENAARINESGLIFEQYIAELQKIAAAV